MRRVLDIASSKIDEVENYICKEYAPVKVAAVETTFKYGLRGQVAHFDDVLIEWSKSLGTYDIQPLTEFNSVIFSLMTTGSLGYKIRGTEIELRQEQAIAYRHPDRVSIKDLSEHSTVAISNQALQKRLSVLLDGATSRKIEFYNAPVERETIAKFADFVCDLQSSPMMTIAASMQHRSDSVADVIVDAFLLSYPSNCSDVLGRPVPSIAPRQVKRALDYIHCYPQQHSSPDVLAALSAVSVRSLQYSFKAVTGHTISEYQQLLRLRHARQEILESPDRSLTEIALKWGFGSLGGFGQSFKKIYGVTPSSLSRHL